jgi:hypothetical protein
MTCISFQIQFAHFREDIAMTTLVRPSVWSRLIFLFSVLLMMAAPAAAQISTIDPNDAIDADLGQPPKVDAQTKTDTPSDSPVIGAEQLPDDTGSPTIAADAATFQDDDLLGAAEGVFGKGAEGLGKLIEDILKKQGKPNGYIVGREGGGAFIVGLRYGSGTLHHRVEGEKPVYWTGPSIGLDAGANAGSTFVLVYNLYDSEDLYKRFPSGEGVAYLVGGFNASYLRRGDIVLIPIRVGAGLRLGANVGYMKFSKKQRWLPF